MFDDSYYNDMSCLNLINFEKNYCTSGIILIEKYNIILKGFSGLTDEF